MYNTKHPDYRQCTAILTAIISIKFNKYNCVKYLGIKFQIQTSLAIQLFVNVTPISNVQSLLQSPLGMQKYLTFIDKIYESVRNIYLSNFCQYHMITVQSLLQSPLGMQKGKL